MKIKIAIPVLIAALLFLFAGCTSVPSQPGAFLARDQKFYDSLGITSNPSPREDGMRSSGREKTYEWWYFDSEYADGTKIVTVFFTKNTFDVQGPAQPTLTIDISLPDGRKIFKILSEAKGTLIRASREKCDVNVKDSYLRRNDAGDYEMHVAVDDIKFDCLMKPKVPMWRPGTGHWYFGDKADAYFAWFVAVPSADLTAKLIIGNQVKDLKGLGYHDHNWGNVEMHKLLNHWYWSRVAFDDYCIIACDLVSEKKYGYARLPVFMIAKDGKILDDDERTVKIVRSDTIQHPISKKFMDNTLSFTQTTAAGTTYKVDLKRKKDMSCVNLLEAGGLSKFKIKLARLIGENPTYIRLTGDATLTVSNNGKDKAMTTSAIWEQMFFGSNKDAIIHDYR
jgi:hypothetical protein